MVARQREWEDGLVGVYKRFLEMCESEIKEDSPLAPAACHCLCQLVQEKPDFNFAINIMDVVVKRVGRKGWDEVSITYSLRLTEWMSFTNFLNSSGSSTLLSYNRSPFRQRYFNRCYQFITFSSSYFSISPS